MTTVTLLTQRSCAFCEQAENVLARLAPDYHLEITRISLDSNTGRELGLRHDVLFAPGLLLNDELFSYGRVSERKLRRELDRRRAALSQPNR